MPQKITFAAHPRTVLGKKSKVFRNQKQIPANISGDVEASIPVVVDNLEFKRLYHKVGDTGLFYIKVEGEKTDRPVLVNEIQSDPLSGQLLHVVFRQVNLSEKVTAEVPVETIGEFEIKDALVVTVHSEIEVEALPQDLPEKFIIDVSKFTEVGQQVTFLDLEYDKSKVELKVEADQLDTPVVMVQAVKEEVEEEPVAAVEGAEGAAPAAEGEAAATDKAEPAADAPKEE
jgi:large subunit ribosomal protein L25